MSGGSYEFFDHTGDFGVEIAAPSSGEVIALAARAFLHLLTDDPDCVREREALRFEVGGVDPAAALVAFGNELLYLFEVEGFLCARFAPDSDRDADAGARIGGTAHGERFDPERHPIARPMKAVTHHGAAFDGDKEVVRARLIFDL